MLEALTVEEKIVIQLTAELWNAIASLGNHHLSDMKEHERDIHDIQSRVMARLARRVHPEIFR